MTLPRSAAEVLADHVLFEIEVIDRMYLLVILSFRVSRGRDLRRLAEDGVFDETGAA